MKVLWRNQMEGFMTEPSTLKNILDAAKREFLEKGFARASLRKIVRDAGVTTGAFYGYFENLLTKVHLWFMI